MSDYQGRPTEGMEGAWKREVISSSDEIVISFADEK
jgi:hypothetical protein